VRQRTVEAFVGDLALNRIDAFDLLHHRVFDQPRPRREDLFGHGPDGVIDEGSFFFKELDLRQDVHNAASVEIHQFCQFLNIARVGVCGRLIDGSLDEAVSLHDGVHLVDHDGQFFFLLYVGVSVVHLATKLVKAIIVRC
jgi:hypothetical protein